MHNSHRYLRGFGLVVAAVVALTGCGSSAGGGGANPPVQAVHKIQDADVVYSMSIDGRLAGVSNGRAAYWPSHGAPPVPLPTLPGHVTVSARSVSADGRIVGYLKTQPLVSYKPVIWDSPTADPRLLPVPQGFSVRDLPMVVGNNNLVVGSLPIAGQGDTALAVWRVDANASTVTNTADARGQQPHSMSDSGVLVTAIDFTRRLWQIDLQTGALGNPLNFTATTGTGYALPESVSTKGRIIGLAGATAASARPAWYKNLNGTATFLPAPANFRIHSLTAGDGIVFGATTYNAGQFRAYAWRNDRLIDLNTRLPANSGLTLERVIGVSATNDVLVSGRQQGVAAPVYRVITGV